MDKKGAYFIVLLLCVAAFIFSSVNHDRVYERRLHEKDLIIDNLVNSMMPLYLQIDSIQKLRNENDTIVYNLTADSLQRYFTDRFGEVVHQGSQ